MWPPDAPEKLKIIRDQGTLEVVGPVVPLGNSETGANDQLLSYVNFLRSMHGDSVTFGKWIRSTILTCPDDGSACAVDEGLQDAAEDVGRLKSTKTKSIKIRFADDSGAA